MVPGSQTTSKLLLLNKNIVCSPFLQLAQIDFLFSWYSAGDWRPLVFCFLFFKFRLCCLHYFESMLSMFFLEMTFYKPLMESVCLRVHWANVCVLGREKAFGCTWVFSHLRCACVWPRCVDLTRTLFDLDPGDGFCHSQLPDDENCHRWNFFSHVCWPSACLPCIMVSSAHLSRDEHKAIGILLII